MASNRIKGLTIQIDGDSTKLQESLREVNKSLYNTQDQLKDVDKLLKLDPTNISLLTQKQELLTKATEGTEEKLKKLREANQAMKDAGVDELSDEYMKVQREIIDCEQQQKKFTEETKKTNVSILQVASGMDKVAKGAKKAADATKPISQAAAGVVTGLVGIGVKAAANADDLNTMAKQSGLATDTLQKMSYAADLIDVDLETAVGSISKMKKNLDKQEDVWERIGVNTKNANGEYRDTEEIFFDVVEALGKIENETERDTIAMDLFGRSADELAGYIDDGGQAYQELAKAAEDSGKIISQEDLNAANALNDEIDKLKASVGADLMQSGVQIAQALTPALTAIADVLSSVAGALKNLSPEAIQVITIILGVIAALSPLLSLIATIATVLPVITPILTAIAGVITGPILAAIAAVIAAIAVWVANWENIKAGFIAFGEIVANTWTIAVNGIKTGINNLKVWFTELKANISQKFDEIKTKITSVIDGIKQKFDEFKEKVKSIWDTIVGIFKGEIPMPKIKMPHITVTGDWSFNPPSAPKFGVEWYRKAMDEAYIMNTPTIFGASGGKLLGGGEAGSETIVGTEKLMDMISQATGSANVNVVLQGDAAGVFKLVRQEENLYFNQHRRSPWRS